MFVNEVRQYVAGCDRIPVIAKVTPRLDRLFQQFPLLKTPDEIPPMFGDPVFSREIPSAEAIRVGNSVSAQALPECLQRPAGGAGHHRLHHQPRYVASILPRVAIHAASGALDLDRFAVSRNRKDVEDTA